VGFFTYELDDQTLAVGAYEDDCHNSPKRLPFGFEDFNVPSLDFVKGAETVSSMTWVNLDHGESTHENELLDQIRLEESKSDEEIFEPSSKDSHVISIDFVEVEVDINVNTPPEGFYDDDRPDSTKVSSVKTMR